MRTVVLLLCGIASTSAFLFGGSGGCGCQQAPACPPPPPPCPPPPSCGCCGGCAKARAAKTVIHAKPSDDLELRARLSGFNLDEPGASAQRQELLRLEKLGEEPSAALLARARASPTVRLAPSKREAKDVSTDTSEQAIKVDQTTTAAPKTSAEAGGSEEKCNNDVLRQLMLDLITENSSESKHAINAAAEKQFGGRIDVICSRSHFSYVYSSNLFCEAAKGPVTCIAFRQSA